MKRSCDIVLINSCREIEGKYIDYLSELSGKKVKVMPVGPLIMEAKSDNNQEAENQEIMQWLDKKDKCSSVYVSFGTEYFLSKEEIEEIAHGLKLSNVNFIWVLRFPVGVEMTIKEALPEGFLDRVKERGMVIKWAPQDQILGHRNLCAFLSHCGWNSVLESIDFGVPVIAIPMHLDQPMHARMLVELGSAVEIERNDEGKLFGQNIAQVIRNVVVEKTGEELRNSVRNVREKIRIKGDEEIDEVVDQIYKLCMKSRKSLLLNKWWLLSTFGE